MSCRATRLGLSLITRTLINAIKMSDKRYEWLVPTVAWESGCPCIPNRLQNSSFLNFLAALTLPYRIICRLLFVVFTDSSGIAYEHRRKTFKQVNCVWWNRFDIAAILDMTRSVKFVYLHYWFEIHVTDWWLTYTVIVPNKRWIA